MYPTKEQIMQRPYPKHRPEVLSYVKQWKREQWIPAKRGSREDRINAVGNLILDINNLCYTERDGEFHVIHEEGSRSSYYLPSVRTVVLVGEPSIITALHELAHHLFGRSELKACRWSVHLFRKTFPRAFARLRWEGHMLRRGEVQT